MDIKTEAIAFAVRLLADHTDLIRKPDTFEATVNSFFGIESYDKKIARDLEHDVKRAVATAKRISTNRKFKKITQNI